MWQQQKWPGFSRHKAWPDAYTRRGDSRAALKLRRHWPTVASVLQSEVPNGGLKDAKANLLADGS